MSTDTILKHTFRKKSEIISREIADETILVPIRGRLADMQRIFSLNPVAEFVWQKIEDEVPVENILSMLINEFAVDETTARNDLVELMQDLISEELVEQVAQA